MKWVIIILIVLAVLLAAALIWTAMKRKKNQVARQRAGELRSEAATSAIAKQEQEARAREAEAEAERARAQADKLDARAQERAHVVRPDACRPGGPAAGGGPAGPRREPP